MKRVISLLMALAFIPAAMADNAANIKIKIAGAMHDNRYFLCLPNVGCLSVLAAEKGKVYPMYEPVQMSQIYMMDVNNNFKVFAQGLPASCHVTVQENQTMTISGQIVTGPKNSIIVNRLHCTVR